MTEKNYLFTHDFIVRDYECDFQGIVNNANYQHYLEHARHEFLIARGIDIFELHKGNIDLVVTRIEIDYKHSLTSRDKFRVCINVRRQGNIRFVFEQDILRIPDNTLIISAQVIGAAIKNGRPVSPADLIEKMGVL